MRLNSNALHCLNVTNTSNEYFDHNSHNKGFNESFSQQTEAPLALPQISTKNLKVDSTSNSVALVPYSNDCYHDNRRHDRSARLAPSSVSSVAASPAIRAEDHPDSVESICQRLQVVEEVEIITSTDILYRYNNVWQNAHWFHDVQLTCPSMSNRGYSPNCHWDSNWNQWEFNNRNKGNSKESSTVVNREDHAGGCVLPDCAIGIKEMQKHMVSYTLEGAEGSRSSGSLSRKAAARSMSESVAVLDICSRLLSAAKEIEESKLWLKPDVHNNADLQVGITIANINCYSLIIIH